MIKKLILCVPIALLLVATPALADGVLLHIPPHDRRIAPHYLPLHQQQVSVSIVDQAATTTVTQIFGNETNRDLEGTYLFALPKGAAVSSFAMWMNGKKVAGEVLRADEARTIYQDIVRRMKDPGLLEYAGRDLFRARVYPVPRRGEVRIEIVYDEVLTMDAGLVAYRYPLRAASCKINQVRDWAIAVEIESSLPIKNLYSPSHDVDCELDRYHASCGFEENGAGSGTDFLLYYAVSETELGASLLTHRIPGDEGFFMLLLSPGKRERDGTVLNKDVIFVIDKSGSMQGEKLRQAKGALRYCMNNLNPGDRFNIITFSTGITALEERLLPVTRRTLRRAKEFVASIEARGGTNIDKALTTALKFRNSDAPRLVIFLTDGLPTAGETDIDDILKHARTANGADARVFSFGVGFDVNTHLLDRLSLENRGTVEYVIPGEDIEETVSSFFIKASNPVLSDIAIDISGITAFDYYPDQLPDLFNGSQLVLIGRYRGSGSAVIKLRGRVDDGKREYLYESFVPRRNRGNSFIPRLWASRKIAYLITEIRLHGENRELIDEVIALSREYGIITPYTSYLITEKGSDDDRGWIVPHARVLAPAMKEAGDGLVNQVGREAVMLDKRIHAERQQTVLDRPEISTVIHVGRKTFYRSEDAWVDAGYTPEMRAIEIRLWSDAYFELLHNHPELGPIMALGERVTFLLEGKAYRIVE